jgi:hypothetical protein
MRPAKETVMENSSKIKTSNPTSPAPAGPNPGNPGDPPIRVKKLMDDCVKESLKQGGAPEDIVGRAVVCSLVKILDAVAVEAAFQPDPPEPGPATPGSPNPGAPAEAKESVKA